MKLARWCLNLKLKSEAKEQLKKVIELNPQHTHAKTMLFSMQQAAELASQRQLDPEVQQATAENVRKDRPNTLDSAVIHNAQRGLGISGLPVIFDLPTPLAIRRANEFFRSVHPLLQAYCAQCHDGNYEGEFQLVPVKNRADRNPDALRANLDATLRLIDPDNPAKSELLSSTLRPHGRGPRPRAIFTGGNDKTYQILATWVQSLRSARMVPRWRARIQHAGRPENVEPFASNRPAITSDSRQTAPAEPSGGIARSPLAGNQPMTNIIPPPLRYRGNVDLSQRNANSPDPQELEFPLPPVLNGFKTPLPTAGTTPKKDARKPPLAAANANPSVTANSPNADSTKSTSPEDAAKSESQAKATGEAGARRKRRASL